jgi:hypothetical protein
VTGCRACGRTTLEPLVDLGESPALAGALFEDAAEARDCVRGRLELSWCPACGHVQNVAFKSELVDYGADYDNSLHFSTSIQHYSARLAGRLVDRYGLAGGHVVEIGSGRGDFLLEVCRLTGGTGTGYDPTCVPESDVPGVTFVDEYFQPSQHLRRYDLLVCRHVLEHMEDPAALLLSLHSDAPPEAVLYLEVPAAEFNFSPDGMWDCIYPHVSYFSAQSLEALVRRSGFDVIDSGTGFDGQFLWVEARPGATRRPVGQDIAEHEDRVHAFARTWSRTVESWRERLSVTEKAVLWGAGMKGVTFLNAVDGEGRLSVVDLNPRKWGKFLPGTGHVVRDPASLDPSVSAVLITNTAYRDEIVGQLSQLGVSADVVPV